jgi:hypothetical protein
MVLTFLLPSQVRPGPNWLLPVIEGLLLVGVVVANSAGDLLAAGSVVWVSNNIAFSLLYWELDSGGAAARAARRCRPPTEVIAEHTGTPAG